MIATRRRQDSFRAANTSPCFLCLFTICQAGLLHDNVAPAEPVAAREVVNDRRGKKMIEAKRTSDMRASTTARHPQGIECSKFSERCCCATFRRRCRKTREATTTSTNTKKRKATELHKKCKLTQQQQTATTKMTTNLKRTSSISCKRSAILRLLATIATLTLASWGRQQQTPSNQDAIHANFRPGHLSNLMSLVQLAEAVSIQRLKVPDLLVLDQQNQLAQPHTPPSGFASRLDQLASLNNKRLNNSSSLQNSGISSLPETASLSINPSSEEISFECLISFDKRKDKNLIVKWYHEDRPEPIYQWIPELSKRSIASHYRSHIVPIVAPSFISSAAATTTTATMNANNNNEGFHSDTNQTQLIEAGFRLVRPTKELGGKYTCSAISIQNDDSKWKKMIVFTPPRSFQLNVSRTDIGAQLASQRERLIQLSQPAPPISTATTTAMTTNQMQRATQQPAMPIQASPFTTISPQMYSTIDYVNVNQQRARQQQQYQQQWQASQQLNMLPANSLNGFHNSLPPPYDTNMRLTSWTRRAQQQQQPQPQTQQLQMSAPGPTNHQIQPFSRPPTPSLNGLKLVCDIDQVFPIPEVNMYSLAKADGSHPEKLSVLDTRIERNPQNGLFHVQVISILDVDEVLRKYGPEMPIYFECLIALTNFELSRYADNKRSAIYWPGQIANSLSRTGQEDSAALDANASSHAQAIKPPTLAASILYLAFLLLILKQVIFNSIRLNIIVAS